MFFDEPNKPYPASEADESEDEMRRRSLRDDMPTPARARKGTELSVDRREAVSSDPPDSVFSVDNPTAASSAAADIARSPTLEVGERSHLALTYLELELSGREQDDMDPKLPSALGLAAGHMGSPVRTEP